MEEDRANLLSTVPLFSGLPRGELKYLAYTLGVVETAPNEILFNENDRGENMFIVIEGRLEVVMGVGTPDEKQLALLGPGEVIGEMSLLFPGGLRSASVRARESSRLWVFTREDFDDLLHRQPHVAYSMVKVMSDRLRRSDNKAFHDLQEKNRQLQKAYDELKAAQAQIIEKEKLEKELQLAAQIQISILPQALPDIPGFDFGAHMDPARAVGGDFYDIFPLDGRRIAVLIGDVADKGVPSALFMARTHALLTSEARNGAPSDRVLRQVNEYLTHVEQANLFVTVIYGILDSVTGTFSYTRAGHEIPLLLAPDGQVTALPKRPGHAIGMLDTITLERQEIVLPPGGLLLLFTDGMVDCRSPQGEDFGHARLQESLARQTGRTAAEAGRALLSDLSAFREQAQQDDDITLVAIHRAA